MHFPVVQFSKAESILFILRLCRQNLLPFQVCQVLVSIAAMYSLIVPHDTLTAVLTFGCYRMRECTLYMVFNLNNLVYKGSYRILQKCVSSVLVCVMILLLHAFIDSRWKLSDCVSVWCCWCFQQAQCPALFSLHCQEIKN